MLMAHKSHRRRVAGRRGEVVGRKWQRWARGGGGASGTALLGQSKAGSAGAHAWVCPAGFHQHPESDEVEGDGVAHFPCLMGGCSSPPASWEHSGTALGTAHPR